MAAGFTVTKALDSRTWKSERCQPMKATWRTSAYFSLTRSTYLNRDEQLGMLVARLRAAYGRHVGEPAWTKFVRRLQAASPEFGRLWAQHEVASPTTYLKVFRHPAHDRLIMTTTSLGVLAAPGTRMVVYTPADEVTIAAVASLIAGEGAQVQYPCWAEHRRQQATVVSA